MSKQAVLKQLESTGQLPIAKLRAELVPYADAYWLLAILDKPADGMGIKKELKIYTYFHQLLYK